MAINNNNGINNGIFSWNMRGTTDKSFGIQQNRWDVDLKQYLIANRPKVFCIQEAGRGSRAFADWLTSDDRTDDRIKQGRWQCGGGTPRTDREAIFYDIVHYSAGTDYQSNLAIGIRYAGSDVAVKIINSVKTKRAAIFIKAEGENIWYGTFHASSGENAATREDIYVTLEEATEKIGDNWCLAGDFNYRPDKDITTGDDKKIKFRQSLEKKYNIFCTESTTYNPTNATKKQKLFDYLITPNNSGMTFTASSGDLDNINDHQSVVFQPSLTIDNLKRTKLGSTGCLKKRRL